MYGYLIEFSSLPATGFALHCKIPLYYQDFTPEQEGIEIVYVKSGTITVEYNDNKWDAPVGSILILKRDLPFKLYTQNNETNEHSTVQILADFKITVSEDVDADFTAQRDALALPFLLSPSLGNERIMKKMNAIISDVADLSGGGSMNRGLLLSSMLYDIAQVWKTQNKINEKSPSILCYKIKKLIAENEGEDISLDFLAQKLDKTPNYLNFVFKKETGTTIHNYILKEKTRKICELILSRALSFKDACGAMGISDVSYGYRMFKKQTGLTPAQFIKGKTYLK